jgi:hypothetical protein
LTLVNPSSTLEAKLTSIGFQVQQGVTKSGRPQKVAKPMLKAKTAPAKNATKSATKAKKTAKTASSKQTEVKTRATKKVAKASPMDAVERMLARVKEMALQANCSEAEIEAATRKVVNLFVAEPAQPKRAKAKPKTKAGAAKKSASAKVTTKKPALAKKARATSRTQAKRSDV